MVLTIPFVLLTLGSAVLHISGKEGMAVHLQELAMADYSNLVMMVAVFYFGNHMINFEGGAIPEEYRVQYVMDRVDTTSTVWLGLTMHCAQCHDLPSPRYKTADQWPAVFDRMLGRMEMMRRGRMMHRGRVESPSASEAGILLEYLKEFGMRPAHHDELNSGNEIDRKVFRMACSQCHVLPSPSLHSLEDWPAVVARMEGNIQLMNKQGITAQGREAINRFLKANSAN